MKKLFTLITTVMLLTGSLQAQFIVVPDSNAMQLVNNFILTGVNASNIVYTGAANTLGTFTGGSLTNLGMESGIAMTTGTFDTALNVSIGDTVGAFANYSNYSAGDSLLGTLIAPWTTYDASILEFDLVPVGNVLEFQYVFASEEYPEYVGTSFNDVVGFFISGQNPTGGNYLNYNIARLPDDSLPVAINNVNTDTNSAYFVDNLGMNGQTIVFDGFTTVLLAQVFVVPGETYHLKMAITDAGDAIFDSGIFLKAQSMKSYFYSSVIELKENSCDVYPNPINSSSVLSITESGKIQLIISDRCGKVVQSKEYFFNQEGSNSIAIGQLLTNYPQGIYFIKISTKGGNKLYKVVK